MKLTNSQIDWVICYLQYCLKTDEFFNEKDGSEQLEEHIGYVIHDFVIDFFRENGFHVETSGTTMNGRTVIYWKKSQSIKLKSLLSELQAKKDFQ